MKISDNLLLASRKLRREQTPWEDKLWYSLREKRFYGLRFRRQFVIGHYIVDFCCFQKKLVVELDGSHHDEQINRQNDAERTAILEAQGYRMIRFWNNEVDENIEGVLETIINNLYLPHPAPSPERGGCPPKP